jgi:serine/threonine-protein kinase
MLPPRSPIGQLPHEYGSLTELALKQQQSRVEPIASIRPEVPDELDRAVRVALEADPARRYRTAVEFAEAVSAGARGEDTESTRALGAADDPTDATQALASGTLATRAMPRAPAPPAARRPEPAHRRDPAAARARRRRRVGNFAILLALLAAGAAVAFAIASSGTGSDISPVDENQIRDQIEGLREFIRENSR